MSRRDVVRVDGSEAATYLQGQISQDVDALSVGSTMWSFVLAPTGKVDAWFRIHRVADDDFLLDVDAGHGDLLIARLERFRLRTDVAITHEPRAELPEPVRWPGIDDVDDEPARIRAGFPRMGAELTENTIPGEAGPLVLDLSVSFTKGCYTGQELVARVDSRGGNVPRPIRLLTAAEGDVLAVGDDITFDGDHVGTVTSAAGEVALAPVLRKVAPGSRVDVGSTSATVSEPVGS